jgi:RimJ/RimL family protein N-acetyltransferase
MSLSPPKPALWKPPRPLPERLETDRLVIRYWRAEDAPAMLEALEVDRASFLPWLPWTLVDNRTVPECIFQIERNRRAREEPAVDDVVLGLFDRATGAPVGGSGFHRMNHTTATAEIGYWVRADRRGEGLCTEAVRGLISWGFAPQGRGGWGFRRIVIFCAALNAASQRVPEKLGLRRELHGRLDRWVDGVGFCDTLGWGVLGEEWDERTGSVKR